MQSRRFNASCSKRVQEMRLTDLSTYLLQQCRECAHVFPARSLVRNRPRSIAQQRSTGYGGRKLRADALSQSMQSEQSNPSGMTDTCVKAPLRQGYLRPLEMSRCHSVHTCAHPHGSCMGICRGHRKRHECNASGRKCGSRRSRHECHSWPAASAIIQ